MPAKGQIDFAIRDSEGIIIPWKKRNREASNTVTRSRMRQRKEENPEKFRAERSRWELQHKYGLTPELKEAWVQAQNGCCFICSQPIDSKTCATDHCHVKNYVRGMLCKPCNSALGLFKDDPNIIRKAAEYLERSKDIGVLEKCYGIQN